jgi:glycosyltransferase involved in cell wall biosynthesis
MKFIVSAYGCEPNKGSEPGIGWQWCLQLARFGEVWVITRSNNKTNIDTGLKELSKDVSERLNFIYYDTNALIRRIKKGDHNLYPYYFLWQVGAYRVARNLCRRMTFDYCFGLTFGSIWMPTFMQKLPVPFIWGPIGGGEAIPDEYISLFGFKESIVQIFRKVMIKTVLINPILMSSIKKAKTIIVRTDDTKCIIPNRYQDKVVTCLETAINCDELYEKKSYEDKYPVEFIYSGRLIKLKALELILRAIEKSHNKERIHFTIVGDGPEREYLEDIVDRNELTQITFVGKKDRVALLELLSASDVFLFPSLKEGGSWSLMEAMGTGLPVICLDSSGMHIITDDECSVRIKVASVAESIEAYTEAIDYMVDNYAERVKLGKKARERILSDFNWNSKGDFLKDLLLLS